MTDAITCNSQLVEDNVCLTARLRAGRRGHAATKRASAPPQHCALNDLPSAGAEVVRLYEAVLGKAALHLCS